MRSLVQKIISIGLRNVIAVVQHRFIKKKFVTQSKKKLLNGTVQSTWQSVAARHNVSPQFSVFWAEQKKKNLTFLESLYTHRSYKDLVTQADRFVAGNFDLLGSGSITFDRLPWHVDFKLRNQNSSIDCQFDANLFYDDIGIKSAIGATISKDIKIPWELSRFAHLFVLAKAYAQTDDERYAHCFVQQVEDWRVHNPFLLGVNWVCPMEVAIRVINWICAWHYFKKSAVITEEFWQSFVCSLYDHMRYLENNWEWYDSRTSNHYLSDLVGYLYVCYFFEDMHGMRQKGDWAFKKIVSESEKQLLPDGMSYEGSTSYHRLVTELFFHASLVAQELQCTIPESFKKRVVSMFEAIVWTKNMSIGDNDSGSILFYGITDELIQRMVGNHEEQDQIKQFPFFGLAIARKNGWEVSLRHHAYARRQPSGHFHNDIGSITVSKNGIPFIVDPGSYVYTASVEWRNYFRSATNHNSFYIEGGEPVPLDDKLFRLNLKSALPNFKEPFHSVHDLYADYSLRAHRTVFCTDAIVVTDWWQGLHTIENEYATCWNYTCATDIVVEHCMQGVRLIHVSGEQIFLLSEDLLFEIIDGWVSTSYGTKIACKQIRAKRIIGADKKCRTIITSRL